MTLIGLRRRMPLLAFILLAVFCLILIGVACACATDHPGQSIEQAISAIPSGPPMLEVWSLVVLVLGATLFAELTRRRPEGPSPVDLQRLIL